MTAALRAVDTPTLSVDERVRLVVRMLLGMNEMSEIELGRRLGLPRTSIYNRMQGRTPFTVAEVGAMAELFGIPPGAFLAVPSALLSTNSTPVIAQKSRAVVGVFPSRTTPSGATLRLAA